MRYIKMTERRQNALNTVARYFGFEQPETLLIFEMSERLPEEKFDDIVCKAAFDTIEEAEYLAYIEAQACAEDDISGFSGFADEEWWG